MSNRMSDTDVMVKQEPTTMDTRTMTDKSLPDNMTPEQIDEIVQEGLTRIVEDEIKRYVSKDLAYYTQLEKDEFIAFVSQIHPRVTEREIYEFFSAAGTIVDIRLVRDARTNKSRGLCYIQFKEKLSVGKACLLTNVPLGGHLVTIEPAANGRTRNHVLSQERERLQLVLRKFTIVNLPFETTVNDVKTLLSKISPPSSVEVVKYSITDAVAFVEMFYEGDCKLAVKVLDGLEILGRKLQVHPGVYKPTVLKHEYDYNPLVLSDASDGKEVALMGLGLTSLIPLYIKPAEIPTHTNLNTTISTGSNVSALITTVIQSTSAQVQASSACIILSNLLNPKEVDDIDRSDIFADVIEEGTKFGKIRKADLDKNGNMFILYDTKDNAAKAQRVFHGRGYDNRKLSCVFAKPAIVKKKYPTWNVE